MSLNTSSTTIYSPFPDLGENIGVYCLGYGTSIWMCCSMTQEPKIEERDTIELFATSLNKTLVILNSKTLDIHVYNTDGYSYVFLLEYDKRTYGLITELTQDNCLRTVFPKSHFLYEKLLDI